MADVCLRVDEVKIRAEVNCDTLQRGEMLLVNGQCFVVTSRFATVGADLSVKMMIDCSPVDWNGRPSQIDDAFWKLLRNNVPPDVWHWSGTFPNPLQEIVLAEQRKDSK